jgi:hypothetical protein
VATHVVVPGSVQAPTVTHSSFVEHAVVRPDGTRLTLADGRGVELRVRPDVTGARRVHRVLRRVERVDIGIDGAGVVATVTGVGHRLPSRIPVSLATALALVLDGAPCTVTLVLAAADEVAS